MKRSPKTVAVNFLAMLWIGLYVLEPSGQAAAAQPQAGTPGGAIITVTSPLDNVTADDVLTLREALLIATGGTGPTGINRPLTVGEAIQTTCTFDGYRNIIGECGQDANDRIQFSSAVTTITLTANLPPLIDNAITTVFGQLASSYVTVDGAGVFHGFDLQSNDNVLQRLNLTHMKDYAVRTVSAANALQNLVITNIAGSGIIISGGSGNAIFAVQVGNNSPCTPGGVSGSGIVMSGATTGNTVTESVLRCNGQYGILLDGAGTTSNTISGGTLGRIEANGLDGIHEGNGAAGNTWSQIPIFDNGGLGIFKSNSSFAPAPVLSSISASGLGFVLSGTGVPGSSVEVYRAATDPGGAGEGRKYLATTTAGPTGAWAANITASNLDCLTAFQTVNSAESSKFATNVCPLQVYLPMVRR